ncbi:mRNA-binding protein [Martiniozyma asiatica (nom. inval.)]|nr:mRNA-binding protein [Martiniozyma asiatica]
MSEPIYSTVQLFVRPVPPNATHSEVQDFFGGVGPLKELRMMPGYVFVEYENAEAASEAFKTLSESTFLGEPLQVEFAKEKPAYAKKGENRVKVSNLQPGTAWQDFKDFMRDELKVSPTFVRIPHEDPTICNLEFASREEMESALTILNETKFNESQLSAEEDTSPYVASASRGGMRGRGRGGFGRGGFGRGGYGGRDFGGRPYPPRGGYQPRGPPPGGYYDNYGPPPPRGGYGGFRGGPSGPPMGGPGGYGPPPGGYAPRGGRDYAPRGGYGRGGYHHHHHPRGGDYAPRGGYGRGGYQPRGPPGGGYPPRGPEGMAPPPSNGDDQYRERDMNDVPSYNDEGNYAREKSPGRYDD